MSDEELRRLERARAATSDPAVLARHLRARLRQGELAPERLALAARIGDEAARIATDTPEEAHVELVALVEELARSGKDASLRTAIALARATLRWQSRFEGPEDGLTALVDAVEAWALEPTREMEDALARARAALEGDELPRWGRAPAIALCNVVTSPPGEVVVDLAGVFGYRGEDAARSWLRRDLVPWLLGTGDPLHDRPRTHGRRFGHEEGMVRVVAVSPDGRRILAAGSSGAVALWTVDPIARERATARERDDLYAAAFSPDGRHVVAGGRGGRVIVFSVETAAEVARFVHSSDDQVNDVAFLSNDRVASAGRDGAIRIWDLSSGGALASHPLDERVTALATSGARIAAGTGDGSVVLLDAATGASLARAKVEGGVVDAAFAGEGLVLATDRAVHVRSASGEVRAVATLERQIFALAVDPARGLAAVTTGWPSVILVSFASGDVVATWDDLSSLPFGVAFARDGSSIIVGERGGGIRTFEVPVVGGRA